MIKRIVLISFLLAGSDPLLTQDSAAVSWTQVTPKNPTLQTISVILATGGGRLDWSKSGNNKIAFDRSGSDSYTDVWTMDPDGTNQVCLTCSNPLLTKYNGNPAWHPSGQYIVFQAQDPSFPDAAGFASPGSGVNNNIWVMNSDGSNARKLTSIVQHAGVLHPHFSHDGTQLLWSEMTDESVGINGNWSIKIADFNGAANPPISNIQSLQPQGSPFFYETHGFSPDDHQILYTRNPDPTKLASFDIYKLDLQSGVAVDLTNTLTAWDEHAHFSQNGTKIDWMSSESLPPSTNALFPPTELEWMDADGSNKERLTYFNDATAPEYIPGGVVVADNDWSPTGDKIALYIEPDTIVVLEFAPPAITVQPQSVTVTVGQTATFSVTTTGAGPLTYQWYKDNVLISGANSTSYTTAASVLGDNGAAFKVTVNNAIGQPVASSPANLTVTALPAGPTGSGLSLNLPSVLSVNGQITATVPPDVNFISFTWSILREGNQANPQTGIISRAASATFSTSRAVAELAPQSLDPGYYSVSVTATDVSGKTYGPAQQNITLVSANLMNVRIFPNPWRSDRNNGPITFDNLPIDSTVKIFTISGKFVKTLTPAAGTVNWPLTNEDGDKVASGLYLYLVTDNQGNHTRGKFTIIK